ncbi:HNH endonuclease [bacterium]|nr:HNH endonuclease [bacterium]MDB4781145.1 HNH endonuclease [Akkermansiaceae bacterium]
MAIYNTSSDGANTSVRAFLTKVGEHYLQHGFNTGSGKGKKIWEEIKSDVFHHCCAYCGCDKLKLTIEHLIMFNRAEFGLHHPGNIVPCCKDCNKRRKGSASRYLKWEEHLLEICKERGELPQYDIRKSKILAHHTEGKYAYPSLSGEELSSIKVISQSLYQNIKTEVEKSLSLYKDLDREFIGKNSI